MANKKSEYYFEVFVDLINYSCKAAELLDNVLNNFYVGELQDKLREMHEIEHTADESKHALIKKLAREFITPIEREDIAAMAEAVDNVTDAIEDVLMRLYMCNINSIRVEAVHMTRIIVKSCGVLKKALGEFNNFRKSDEMHGLIVEINNLEEEADKLYTEAVRRLYVSCKDCLEVMAWDDTFHYLEKCCDTCEMVADILESIILKNS